MERIRPEISEKMFILEMAGPDGRRSPAIEDEHISLWFNNEFLGQRYCEINPALSLRVVQGWDDLIAWAESLIPIGVTTIRLNPVKGAYCGDFAPWVLIMAFERLKAGPIAPMN